MLLARDDRDFGERQGDYASVLSVAELHEEAIRARARVNEPPGSRASPSLNKRSR